MRSHVLVFLGGALNFRMGANLFNHLVRLPLTGSRSAMSAIWFPVSAPTQPIRRLFSEGLVAAVVDGLMARADPDGDLLLQRDPGRRRPGGACDLRRSAVRPLSVVSPARGGRHPGIAKEQTSFIETARAMQSIKIFGREADRERVWQNRHADSISRKVGLAASSRVQAGNDLIYGLENVLVVYLGAR